ncbi:hypothetical protein CI109_102014 [Kwoniella shandongensis]|uniref:Uncharacterized protein n=1 Tax=Kwoniella shandongensis TaxID=1734106 RepID=A0A5M6BQA4_9TREE|nr:uncharacterized protein CI109_006550 [Kwoniella shandongensis]KAA5525088.1 hypothetical protein CI109_006550 [Kwoniella shandongensis]
MSPPIPISPSPSTVSPSISIRPHLNFQTSQSSSYAGPGPSTESHRHDSLSLSPGRKRRKVTRSKLGCLTCRRRRKLCDMTKPECGACVRLKMECTWPDEEATRQPRRRSQPAVGLPSHPPNRTSTPNTTTLAPLQPSSTLIPRSTSHQHERLAARDAHTPVSGTMEDFVGIFGEIGGDVNGNTTMPYDTPSQDMGLMDWLAGGGSLDEATLQLWAADCLAVPTTQTFNAFDSLNSVLLQPTPPSDPNGNTNGQVDHPLTLASIEEARSSSRNGSRSRRASRSPPSRNDTPTGSSQTALLNYFHESLSRLVSCTGDAAPSAFESFTKLANMTVGRGPAGQGLHLSILAWTARHMVNRGLMKYEAVSEKFSSQATNLVNERMVALFDGATGAETGVQAQAEENQDKDTEKMTLLAASLMLMQFKICRGDVWGFGTIVQHLTRLVPFVFREGQTSQPDSMHYQFFENILYHDVLGSFILNGQPMVPNSIASHHSSTALETLHTLTGVSLPLFSTMHRVAALVRQRRSRRGKGWSDEDLLDVVQPALDLEAALTEEKKRLDHLVSTKPHIASHRYLHEAFRTASLLQIRYQVLGEPACSLNIRLLVRQALSLLEAMCDQNLPGFCSAHWVLFLAALCSVEGGQAEGELDDRDRIDRIYDDFMADFGFLNVERSRKIVQEVWTRNSGGQVFVDWLDILEEYDWEIFIV